MFYILLLKDNEKCNKNLEWVAVATSVEERAIDTGY